MGASLIGSVTEMAKSWAARRTFSKSAEKRMYSAVAVMQDLERRQLLSAVNPFPNPPFVSAEVVNTEKGNSEAFAIAVADINGDGIPDVITANFNGTVTVTTQYSDQHGRGTGFLYYNSAYNHNSSYTSTFSDGLGEGEGNAHDLSVGKLANGKPIIVVANNYGNSGGADVSVIVGDGHGGWQHYSLDYATNAVVNGVAIAQNIYNENETDIVTANSNGDLSIIRISDTEGDVEQNQFSPGENTEGGLYSPEIGDFNGEGNSESYNTPAVDIAYTDEDGDLFVKYANSYYHSDGDNAAEGDNNEIATNVESFAVGKLDSGASTYSSEFRADDIVTLSYPETVGKTTQQTLKTFIGGSGAEGSLTLGSALVTDYYMGSSVQLADMNGDGKLDAVVSYFGTTSGGSDSDGDIYMLGFQGYGNGRLGASAFVKSEIGFGSDYPTYSFTLSDMNGDGKADALFGYYNFDNGNAPVAIALNSDDVIESPPVFTSPNITFFNYGSQGDFNVTTTGAPAASIYSNNLPSDGLTYQDDLNGTASIQGDFEDDGPGGIFYASVSAYNHYDGGTAAHQEIAVVEFGNQTTNVAFGSNVDQEITPSGYSAATVTFINSNTTPADGIALEGNGEDGYTLETDQNGITTPAGQYLIDLSATNGVDAPVTEEITLNVVAPPVFTSADDVAFARNVFGSFTVSASSFPLPGDDESFTLISGALPPGMEFFDNGNGTATIEGTPTGKVSHFSITVDASNGVSDDSFQSISITVQPAKKPSISVSDPTFQVGEFGSFNVTTTGYPSVPLGDLNVEGLPDGVTFTDHGDGTGTVSGTPAPNTGGTYTLTITADNGIGEAEKTVKLIVAQPIVIDSENATVFDKGDFGEFEIDITGYPVGDISILGSLPPGLKLKNGVIEGTPTKAGTYHFTISVAAAPNNKNRVLQAFTLTVDP
jgi:hypothetical protein